MQLLTKDPESRLSSLRDLQNSPYLADVNWDAVLEKALMPGFVPNVSEAPFMHGTQPHPCRWPATPLPCLAT